jgi:SAM-dependent methyltransferase
VGGVLPVGEVCKAGLSGQLGAIELAELPQETRGRRPDGEALEVGKPALALFDAEKVATKAERQDRGEMRAPAPHQEIWGVDIWASAILWCKEHLSPPFHFATTTVTPHLPFEDRSFGLVFAGSVWTHLDDLAEAWALEVHRILRPGGCLYFSINDRSAVKVFEGGGIAENRARYLERIRPDNWSGWLRLLESHSGYQRFAEGDAQMVTMGRSTQAHVMWDVDYLLKRWGPGWRICSVTPEAYGHQTGVLLARI